MADAPFSSADLARCLAVLEAAQALAPEDPAREALERAAAALVRSAKKKRRLARSRAASAHDREVSSRAARTHTSMPEPVPRSVAAGGQSPGELRRERRCYVCKQPYREVHAFYHLLCPGCAAENLSRRDARADLRGRRALVTGGRIKIGFHLACKLLRDGAHVTITTRFPRDAARRFAALPDAADLADRLRIVGIDLRSLPDVLALGEQLAHEVVDIVVHNAAQTVRRPAAYHEAWALAEAEPLEGAAAALWSGDAADVRPALAKVSRDALLFPAGATDVEGLPLDLRQVNSWRLAIEDVGAAELLETHVVNAMVPFLLTSRLVPAMRSAAPEDRYIVNVSAVEGQFVRPYKTPFHPHTNMAKAALNMMTRTSAAALAEDGIFMTSVDTGWITDEDPAPRREAKRRRGFCPPLDVIDGAARVYDPIVRGVAGGERLSGVLLKDYRPAPW